MINSARHFPQILTHWPRDSQTLHLLPQTSGHFKSTAFNRATKRPNLFRFSGCESDCSTRFNFNESNFRRKSKEPHNRFVFSFGTRPAHVDCVSIFHYWIPPSILLHDVFGCCFHFVLSIRTPLYCDVLITLQRMTLEYIFHPAMAMPRTAPQIATQFSKTNPPAKPDGWMAPYRMFCELQRLMMADARKKSTQPVARSMVARAIKELEAMKREIKMLPKPRPIDVQVKSSSRKSSSFTSPTERAHKSRPTPTPSSQEKGAEKNIAQAVPQPSTQDSPTNPPTQPREDRDSLTPSTPTTE